MDNPRYGTVRVFDIKTGNKDQRVPECVDLDNIDLEDPNNSIREALESELAIDDVESFDWDTIEPGDEEADKIERVKAVLRRYFDTTDDGEVSPDFDEDFSAQDAIDEIHDIVGDI